MRKVLIERPGRSSEIVASVDAGGRVGAATQVLLSARVRPHFAGEQGGVGGDPGGGGSVATCQEITFGTAPSISRDFSDLGVIAASGNQRIVTIPLDWNGDRVVIYDLNAAAIGDFGLVIVFDVQHQNLPQDGCFLLIINNIVSFGYPDVEVNSTPLANGANPLTSYSGGGNINPNTSSHIRIDFSVDGGILTSFAQTNFDYIGPYAYP